MVDRLRRHNQQATSPAVNCYKKKEHAQALKQADAVGEEGGRVGEILSALLVC